MPRAPPTKSMRLSVRTSPIPQQRLEYVPAAAGRRRARSRARASAGVARERLERVPAPVETTSRPPPLSRRHRQSGRDRDLRLRNASRNCCGRLSGQVLDDAVVGKNLHLIVGERHGNEAAGLRCVAADRELGPGAGGAGGAVMPRRQCITQESRQKRPRSPGSSLAGHPSRSWWWMPSAAREVRRSASSAVDDATGGAIDGRRSAL